MRRRGILHRTAGRRRLAPAAGTLALAAALCLLPTVASSAATPPILNGCSPLEPVARIAAPAYLVDGSRAAVKVDGYFAGSGTLTASQGDDALGASTHTSGYFGTWLELTPRGTDPVDLSLTYHDPDDEFPACTVTISTHVDVARPQSFPIPRPAIAYPTDPKHGVTFRLAAPAHCETDYVRAPLILQIRLRAKRRWVGLGTSDPCDGWDEVASTNGDGSRYALTEQFNLFGWLGHDSQVAQISIYPPWRTGVVLFPFRVMAGRVDSGRLVPTHRLEGGTIRLVNHHTPSHRIYAWIGGRLNDAYWNYCVNQARPTFMSNGDAYCNTESYSDSRLSLR